MFKLTKSHKDGALLGAMGALAVLDVLLNNIGSKVLGISALFGIYQIHADMIVHNSLHPTQESADNHTQAMIAGWISFVIVLIFGILALHVTS